MRWGCPGLPMSRWSWSCLSLCSNQHLTTSIRVTQSYRCLSLTHWIIWLAVAIWAGVSRELRCLESVILNRSFGRNSSNSKTIRRGSQLRRPFWRMQEGKGNSMTRIIQLQASSKLQSQFPASKLRSDRRQRTNSTWTWETITSTTSSKPWARATQYKAQSTMQQTTLDKRISRTHSRRPSRIKTHSCPHQFKQASAACTPSTLHLNSPWILRPGRLFSCSLWI